MGVTKAEKVRAGKLTPKRKKIAIIYVLAGVVLMLIALGVYNTFAKSDVPKTPIEYSERDIKDAKNDTDKLNALFKQANLYTAQNDYDNALKTYLRANELKPNDPIILGDIADIYFFQKNKAEAIKYYDLAISSAKKSASKYADNIENWNAAIKLANENKFTFTETE